MTSIGGFASTVFLSASGVPWGVDVAFWQDAVYVSSGTTVSEVTFTVGAGVPSDLYYVSLIGRSQGGTCHTAMFRLRVTSYGPVSDPDLEVFVLSNSLSVPQGDSVQADLHVASIAGFSSNVFIERRPTGYGSSFLAEPSIPKLGCIHGFNSDGYGQPNRSLRHLLHVTNRDK